MPQKNPWLDFHLQLLQRSKLSLGKFSNILLNLDNILDSLFRNRSNDILDFLFRQLERLWGPFVEFLGIPADGGVAFGADVVDDAFYYGGDIYGGLGLLNAIGAIGAIGLLGIFSGFKIFV